MGDSCLTFSAFCSCGTRSSFSRLTSGFFSGARMRHVILDVCNRKREKHRFKNRIQLTYLASSRGPLLLCINLDLITRIACVASVSNRVIARKLEREPKKETPSFLFSFCSRPNFCRRTRAETLATQAITRRVACVSGHSY